MEQCGSITPEGHERNSDIECLRVFAIAATLLQHCPALFAGHVPRWYSATIPYATFVGGVDLFLVISGFLIGTSILRDLAGQRCDRRVVPIFAAFWTRRAFRLLPAAWLWVTLTLAASILTRPWQVFGPMKGTLSDAVAAVLQIANWHYSYCYRVEWSCGTGVLGPYWSLSLEEQFYFVLPFLVVYAGRKIVPVVSVLILAQLFVARPFWSVLWTGRSDALLLGLLMALAYQQRLADLIQVHLPGRSPFIVYGALGLLLITAPSPLNVVSWSTGLLTLICGMILWPITANRNYFRLSGALKSIVLWLAARSYSIYVCHLTVFTLVNSVSKHQHSTLVMVEAVLVTLVCADLTHRFVEMPFRRKGIAVAQRVRTRRTDLTSNTVASALAT